MNTSSTPDLPIMPLDCDGFAGALADYLEGDAPESIRLAVDAHAVECAECRDLLADLAGIRTTASALPQLVPTRDLWQGIAERIDAPVLPLAARGAGRATVQRTWFRPAIAAAALVIATAGITYQVTRASMSSGSSYAPAPATTVASATAAPVVDTVVVESPAAPVARVASSERVGMQSPSSRVPKSPGSRFQGSPSSPVPQSSSSGAARFASTAPTLSGEPVFTSEISRLRRIVRERREQLDPATITVLEQSIAVIDSAIAQSRAALLKDPASGFLATQLNHSLEKKVELLRTAAMLPARS